MGRQFFGVDIQQEVADAIPPGSMPQLFLKKGVNSYETRGNVGVFSYDEMSENRAIQQGDQKIVLIAQPLDNLSVEPAKGDLIIDDTGKNFVIIAAKTNSARARWVCQCRG